MATLIEATVRILEAVVSLEREAFARRVREGGELEQLRARFERLRALANTHEAELEEWSRRAGRQVRVPRIVFPWPPAPVWEALMGAPAQAPELVWEEDAAAPSE